MPTTSFKLTYTHAHIQVSRESEARLECLSRREKELAYHLESASSNWHTVISKYPPIDRLINHEVVCDFCLSVHHGGLDLGARVPYLRY